MPIAADLPDDIDALKQFVVARTAERDAFKVEREMLRLPSATRPRPV